MMSRKSARHAPACTAASAAKADTESFGSLPTEVVQAILGHLTMRERHSAAVLVCKQWHAACHSPCLLRHLAFPSSTRIQAAAPRLHSFCAWLLQGHARHARTATFVCSVADEQDQEALAMCLTALAATSGSLLTELTLDAAPDVHTLDGWPAGLTSLRCLTVRGGSYVVQLGSAMRMLRCLERLHLSGGDLRGLHHLPCSITHLAWDWGTTSLPAELSLLTSLASLSLDYCVDYDGDGAAAVLTTLHSLYRLQLTDTRLPACLPQLTQLRAWRWHLPGLDAAGAQAPAVLPASLQQLTAVALQSTDHQDGLAGVLRALSQLPNIQRFAYTSACLPATRVAACTSLSKLRWLALDCQTLLANLQLLRAASRLERLLVIGGTMPRQAETWQPLWDCVKRQASLQHLMVLPEDFGLYNYADPFDQEKYSDSCSSHPPDFVLDALEHLQQRRPNLTAAYVAGPYKSWPTFWEEFFADP